MIDRTFGQIGTPTGNPKAASRATKNYVVLTLRKMMRMRTATGIQLGSKLQARKLYDIMRKNERTGTIQTSAFHWQNNNLNTPAQEYSDDICGFCANTDPACPHYKSA